MWRLRRCSNQPQVSARWIPGISKGTSPSERRRRTLKALSLLTLLPLIHLIGNSHLLLTRLPPPSQRKTKTKVFDVDKDGNKAKVYLQRVLMSLPRRKKESSPKSIAPTTERRVIMPTIVRRRRNRSH